MPSNSLPPLENITLIHLKILLTHFFIFFFFLQNQESHKKVNELGKHSPPSTPVHHYFLLTSIPIFLTSIPTIINQMKKNSKYFRKKSTTFLHIFLPRGVVDSCTPFVVVLVVFSFCLVHHRHVFFTPIS